MVFRIFQSNSPILPLVKSYTLATFPHYPHSRQSSEAAEGLLSQYHWMYALTISTQPGYNIQTNLTYHSACEFIKLIQLYDGPSGAFPLIYTCNRLQHQHHQSANPYIQTFGPKLHIELSLLWANETYPEWPFEVSFTSAVISKSTIYKVGKSTKLYNLTCPYNGGIAQCLWKFMTSSSVHWLNMTIQRLDTKPLWSLGCTRGIFAVYDESFLVESDSQIAEMCSEFQHDVQRNTQPGGNSLCNSCFI